MKRRRKPTKPKPKKERLGTEGIITDHDLADCLSEVFQSDPDVSAPEGCNCRLSVPPFWPRSIVQVVCTKHGVLLSILINALLKVVDAEAIAGSVIEFGKLHYKGHTRRLRK